MKSEFGFSMIPPGQRSSNVQNFVLFNITVNLTSVCILVCTKFTNLVYYPEGGYSADFDRQFPKNMET